jgi:hypothetical protein
MLFSWNWRQIDHACQPTNQPTTLHQLLVYTNCCLIYAPFQKIPSSRLQDPPRKHLTFELVG